MQDLEGNLEEENSFTRNHHVFNFLFCCDDNIDQVFKALENNDQKFFINNAKNLCKKNVVDENGYGLIEYSLLGYPQKTRITRILLEEGCKPQTNLTNGETAILLLLGSREAEIDLISMLVNAGVKINQRSTRGDDALLFSIMHGRLDLFKALLQMGAKINTYNAGRGILMEAASQSSEYKTTILEFIIKNRLDDIDRLDNNQRSALFYAIKSNNIKGAEILIKSGINIMQKDIKGKTAR